MLLSFKDKLIFFFIFSESINANNIFFIVYLMFIFTRSYISNTYISIRIIRIIFFHFPRTFCKIIFYSFSGFWFNISLCINRTFKPKYSCCYDMLSHFFLLFLLFFKTFLYPYICISFNFVFKD